jgi:hypothetical protein
MYQAIKSNDPSKLPIIFAKLQGNQVSKLKKDEYIWHSQYEKILNLTVVFIQVESASSPEDKALFEKSTNIYLRNKGFKVLSTVYHDDSSTLKQYLTMK